MIISIICSLVSLELFGIYIFLRVSEILTENILLTVLERSIESYEKEEGK